MTFSKEKNATFVGKANFYLSKCSADYGIQRRTGIKLVSTNKEVRNKVERENFSSHLDCSINSCHGCCSMVWDNTGLS